VNSFLRSVAAEFAKVFTTRLWWMLAIVLFFYIALLAGGLGALFAGIQTGVISPDAVSTGGGSPSFSNLPPLIYGFASSVGYVFPLLLGALATTGELRHQTLTPTFLASPRRGMVLGAKTLALTLIGAGFGLVAIAASVGVGGGVLGAFGVDALLLDPETWLLVARTLLAMGLWAAVGVGIGVLVPNQVASIVVVLAFTQFVEPLLRLASSFLEVTAQIGNFLPGAASDALVGASVFSLANPTTVLPLNWWQGGLTLLGYALIATLLGYLVSWKKDVT
jgi:hypothetical protein